MSTIIISDIHQRIKKAQKLLNLDADSADRIIFLGDYWDSFDAEAGVEDTCGWMFDVSQKYGDKITWLVGNHDIPYIEDFYKARTLFKKYGNIHTGRGYIFKNKKYFCSGYTKSKSEKISKTLLGLDINFFDKFELCTWDQGYLISHAGFHPIHLHPYKTIDKNIKSFQDRWKNAKENLLLDDLDDIWSVGLARGGKATAGGPLWLDWNLEFEPIKGLKQIVGHTVAFEIRYKDGNFCIDTCNETSFSVTDGVPKYEYINI